MQSIISHRSGVGRRHRRAGTPARHKQQPYPREAGVLLDIPPEIQLDLYPGLVIMTKRTSSGWWSHPIDTDALINTLADLPSSSGILPPNCLATGRAGGETYYAVYVPPMRTTLQFSDGVATEQTIPIPTPPLIWAGCGTTYRIWSLATEEDPTEDTPLYTAPFPNCYNNGGICWGDADPRPRATASNLMSVLDLFLHGSKFNSHISNRKSKRKPTCVITLYPELADQEEYPLDDLEPAQPHTLRSVIDGDIW